MTKKKTIKEMKECVSEFIGRVEASKVRINGEDGQVVIDAEALVRFLKELREAL